MAKRVSLVTEAWLAGLPGPLWRGDAMEHLRQIQRHASFPLVIRQAAERLSTAVPHRHSIREQAASALSDGQSHQEYIVHLLHDHVEKLERDWQLPKGKCQDHVEEAREESWGFLGCKLSICKWIRA